VFERKQSSCVAYYLNTQTENHPDAFLWPGQSHPSVSLQDDGSPSKEKSVCIILSEIPYFITKRVKQVANGVLPFDCCSIYVYLRR
jgi:hypothetical protein